MKMYVNLKTDWGFKHFMGQKAQMLSFLNSLLSEEYGVITSLDFDPTFTPQKKFHLFFTLFTHITKVNSLIIKNGILKK